MSLVIVLVMALALPVASQMQEPVDYDALYKIKDEGLQRSQVMDILSYLTDVHGARLTGSPNIRAAADWTMKKMTEWGLVNVKLEPWGPFGRGWVNERFSANVVAPNTYPLIGYPMAWTPGTNGAVTAEAVLAVMETEADFEKFRGKLKGKFVLPMPLREVKAHFEAEAERYTDAQLADLAKQIIPGDRPQQQFAAMLSQRQFAAKRAQFLLEEGVAAVLEPSRGDGGTVFVQSGGSRDPKEPPAPPRVMLAIEHYGRIFRTLQKNVPVSIEMSVQNRFIDEDPKTFNAFNVVGEIPGADKAAEVVMVGAHFDSWHAGTGATDNGIGSAVMLEAMRILKASGLKLRRTVRIGLWGGEEQGLLGSRAYIKEHFGDRETMALKPEHAKFAGYFNVDNGAGAVRGVYLQGNEAIAPVFSRWIEPLKNLGVTTLAIRNTGGTDHLAFDDVGLPGFQFIQDDLEYNSRTHHSNMDVFERAQPQDLKQIATVVAFFVYQTANREQLLPRKPLPKPQPAPHGPGGGPPRM
ncbi:MAG: M20/M25/M40 family metallo-hydrolase [Acidobacteria bacterium]|nr:M20/M25/M40 family metallo-hydrolase [Acidobacteriota bacterium]